MGCIAPIMIKDPRNLYVEGHPLYMEVPCGHCLGCLKKRQNDYSIRVAEELKSSTHNCFLTLTYRDESVPVGFDESSGEVRLSLRQKHFVDFVKYMRQVLVREGYRSPRIFACGEYGTKTFRPHYHCVVIGACTQMLYKVLDYWRDRYGFVLSEDIGLTQKDKQSVGMYVGKYSSKGVFIEESPLMVPFIEKPFLISSHFLGVKYMEDRLDYFSLVNESSHYENFDDFVSDFSKNFVYRNGSFTYSLPRYYKDYFYNHVDGKTFLDSVIKKSGFDPVSENVNIKVFGYNTKGQSKEFKRLVIPSFRDSFTLSLQRISDAQYRQKCRQSEDVEGLSTLRQMASEEFSAKYTLLGCVERKLESFYSKSRL